MEENDDCGIVEATFECLGEDESSALLEGNAGIQPPLFGSKPCLRSKLSTSMAEYSMATCKALMKIGGGEHNEVSDNEDVHDDEHPFDNNELLLSDESE